jgi:hypothetical protein
MDQYVARLCCVVDVDKFDAYGATKFGTDEHTIGNLHNCMGAFDVMDKIGTMWGHVARGSGVD